MVDAFLALPNFGTNVIYAFSGTQYARVNFASDKIETGPHWITSQWGTFKKAGFGTVDAIVEVPNEPNQFYAFYGGQYFRAKIDSNGSDSFVYSAPKSIASEWPGLVEAGFDTIDAAVVNPTHPDQIYFFSGTRSLEYSVSKSKICWGPHTISEGWPSLKEAGFDRVDAIVKKPETDHIYYVFRGNQYVRIHWKGGDGTVDRHTDFIKDQWKCLSPWV
ncbi:hypothetical protein PENPOL_c022G09465 [Penicillium polonicum]|uniref:Hemopexin n=1 Tax=Penicillium polonicum TaxID=60169 RepID=A0A1V6N762_PENPO|nr:hypothetical protein PENPOL_c022G09465 [Penicillium polonicum]